VGEALGVRRVLFRRLLPPANDSPEEAPPRSIVRVTASERESFREMLARHDADRKKQKAEVLAAWSVSPAILVVHERGREEVVILSPEPSNPELGPMRATTLMRDGPWGHNVGTTDKLAEDVRGYVSVRPLSEAEVMAWTSMPQYVEGAKAVAFIQADNEIRFLAGKIGKREEADEYLRRARAVFETDRDAAVAILHEGIAKLSGEQASEASRAAADRFWEKVNKRGPVPKHRPKLGPCWVWTGGKSDTGYGLFWQSGGVARAHRVAWELERGPIPSGLDVLHACDNPACVRPSHLSVGTKSENASDREAKGRGGRGLAREEAGVVSAAEGSMPTATVAYETTHRRKARRRGRHVCPSGCACGGRAKENGELSRDDWYNILRSELARVVSPSGRPEYEDPDDQIRRFHEEYEGMRLEGLTPSEAIATFQSTVERMTPEQIRRHNEAARTMHAEVEREEEAARFRTEVEPIVRGHRESAAQHAAWIARVQRVAEGAASTAGIQYTRIVTDPSPPTLVEPGTLSAESFYLVRGKDRVARVVVFVDRTVVEPTGGTPITFPFGHGDVEREQRMQAFVHVPEQPPSAKKQKREENVSSLRNQSAAARAQAVRAAQADGVPYDQIVTTGQALNRKYEFRLASGGKTVATVVVEPRKTSVNGRDHHFGFEDQAVAVASEISREFRVEARDPAPQQQPMWGKQYMPFLGQWAVTYGGFPFRIFNTEPEADAFLTATLQTGQAAYESAAEPRYYALDPTDRIVAGPFRSYDEANQHARRVRGYVKLSDPSSPYPSSFDYRPDLPAIGAESRTGAADFESQSTAMRGARRQGYTHIVPVDPSRMHWDGAVSILAKRGPQGWQAVPLFYEAGRYHIGGPAAAMTWTRLPHDAEPMDRSKPEEELVPLAAGEGPHAQPVPVIQPPPPPPAPYPWQQQPVGTAPPPAARPIPGAAGFKFKELRWHRDESSEGVYYAEAPGFGRFTITKRTPDRRHDVLPWVVKLAGSEIGQTDNKGQAQALARKYVRNAIKLSQPGGGMRLPKRWPAGVPRPEQVDPTACGVSIVQRSPACVPNGVDADSAKAVFDIVRERYLRQGHETLEVIGVSKQGEMIGTPVQVSQGQVSSVNVDLEQILGAALSLASAGAVSFWLVHGHPSGHSHPSAQDKHLTQMVRQGAKVVLPNTKFRGHIVVGSKDFSQA
jgi:hypothetical protein